MLIPVVHLSERERDEQWQRGPAERLIAAEQAFPHDVRVLADRLPSIAPTGLGAGDQYFITPPFDCGGWPRVEVCRAEVLSGRLVGEVHAAVCLLAGADQVEICDALGCLETAFNVFVRRDLISVFAEDHVLRELRLAGTNFETLA